MSRACYLYFPSKPWGNYTRIFWAFGYFTELSILEYFQPGFQIYINYFYGQWLSGYCGGQKGLW